MTPRYSLVLGFALAFAVVLASPSPPAAGQEMTDGGAVADGRADAEASAAATLPPRKRAAGKASKFVVSEDGSAMAIVIATKAAKAEVWHFEADSAEGRKILETDHVMVGLTLTPNGRFAYVQCITEDTASRIDVIEIGEKVETYGHTIESSDVANATVTPGPGESQVTISADRLRRVVDLATGDRVESAEDPSHEEPSAVSADRSVFARNEIYDVIVSEVGTGKELMRIERDSDKSDPIRKVLSVSEKGEIVICQARTGKAVGRKKRKNWLEGWDVAKGKLRWKLKVDHRPEELVIGPTRFLSHVKAKVKLYDVSTGRPVKTDLISSKIVGVGASADRRTFWVATDKGDVIPVR